MNRIIKFRAWDGRKVFDVDVLAISNCIWSCPDHGKRGVSLAYQSQITLMQFTGLLDKNGKEIYEGDVIEKDGERWQIMWSIPRAGFRFLSIHSKKRKFGGTELRIPESVGCQQYLMDEMCVIGSIHENPELLKP